MTSGTSTNDVNEPEQPGNSVNGTSESDRARGFAAKAIIGAAVFIGLILITVSLLARRGSIPELTRSEFDRALSKWNSSEPSRYSITTTVVGRQPATYSVAVANGDVVVALRNDHPLKDQRTLGTWSVPGMFRTIEHDLIAIESDAANGVASSDLHLRAEFDPQWGFPTRYLRVEWTSGAQVSWSVDQFENGASASVSPNEDLKAVTSLSTEAVE